MTLEWRGRPITVENILLAVQDPAMWQRIPRRRDFPELLSRDDISNVPCECFLEVNIHKMSQRFTAAGWVFAAVWWRYHWRQMPLGKRVSYPLHDVLFRVSAYLFPMGAAVGALDGWWEAEAYRGNIKGAIERAKEYRGGSELARQWTGTLGCFAGALMRIIFSNEGFGLIRGFAGAGFAAPICMVVSLTGLDETFLRMRRYAPTQLK